MWRTAGRSLGLGRGGDSKVKPTRSNHHTNCGQSQLAPHLHLPLSVPQSFTTSSECQGLSVYPEPHTSPMSTLAYASLRQTPFAPKSVLHSTSFFLWGSLYDSRSSYLHHVSISLFSILSFSAELYRSYPHFPVTPHSPRITHADLMI